MNAETAWSAGRLRGRGAPGLLFGEMYEDWEIERKAFAGRGKVFCIASAGTTALRMAEEHEVVACDVNPAQLAYVEERVAGAPRREGRAEQAMRFARALMPLAGWRESVVRDFLRFEDVEEQALFWRARMDTRAFRMGFDAMLSKVVLRNVYAREFLTFLPKSFGSVVRGRMARGFATHANATNAYARLLLRGEYPEEPAWRSVGIEYVLEDAASYLETCVDEFEGFALSNILDGATAVYRERLMRAVRRAATKDAVMVLRSFAEPTADVGLNLSAVDRAMLWGIVTVRGVFD